MRITVQAQAKINWALDILSRREDGYHEMDMLMQKIALSDEIRFETARWTTLTVNGHLIYFSPLYTGTMMDTFGIYYFLQTLDTMYFVPTGTPATDYTQLQPTTPNYAALIFAAISPLKTAI